MAERIFMERAIELAAEAGADGEVPVGAVIVRGGEIVSEGRNRREKKRNALCHAEIEAINNACDFLGKWRLDDCEMYVTLEPCPMCAGAVINSRIKRLIYGAYDIKAGSADSVINLFSYPYNHKPEIHAGYMEKECSQLLTDFFRALR